MSSTETPEAKELSLVGKVEMRIAMAPNDSSLEKTLNVYLAPLLLKLASEFVSVRNKERLDLLPTLLHGLQANYEESTTHAATLFNLFLKLLHSMTLPPRGNKDDLELRSNLGLAERANDASFVATWLGKLILFGINQPGATRCPGLSKEDCSFLQLYGKKDAWTPNAAGGLNLVETKVVASRFLASGAFVDSERFLPGLFASADPNSRISDIGDDILKRASSAVSFEDSDLVQHLYEMYLGTRGVEGSLPARPPLQTKILSILCRSRSASSFVSQSTQIIEEALTPLNGPESNGNMSVPKQGLEASKLRGQVFAFTNWLTRISSPNDLTDFAPGLVTQLQSYIETQGWPQIPPDGAATGPGELASRAYAYESIGILAASCPSTLLREPNLELLRWLFTSLSEDSSGKDTSASIEQALSSVLGALGGELDSDLELSLTSLLVHHMGLRPGVSEESGAQIIRNQALRSVKSPPVMDADWERNIDALVANDEAARSKLVAYFREFSALPSVHQNGAQSLEIYLQASFAGMTSQTSGDVNRAGDFLLELCSLAPQNAYTGLSGNISSLQQPIFSTNKTLRDKASHIFGFLATLKECSESETQKILNVLKSKLDNWRQAIGGEVLDVHGAILATAYFLSRSVARSNLPAGFDEKRRSFIITTLNILDDSRDKMLLEAVFVALSDLALFGALIPETIPAPRDVRHIVQKLRDKAKDGDEKAITAMGHMAIHFPEEDVEDGILSDLINKLYELHIVRQAEGNRVLKNDLIRDLVGSFTGTNAGLAGNVSEDTELFDAGALPTGEGNSVTTYKDIMSLAAEVGDSSLVYRFMSLASNNAIWSSRAAFGRFGLSNILSDASTDGYLAQNPKLYPALFRYRFDPNTNVRNSMNDIWAALVKEPAKTIDLNFDRIMDDLLKNILGKEWRVRQASCAAIADLVQGRSLEKYDKYLTQIWELTFKVCDDIKESVRTAAMALARVLTGILTRGLEAGEASARSAEKMLKQVLPFLLSPSGLESGAAEVQDFARKTLLKIIKSSNGKTLRPFIPDLVSRLLALLSSIEPEMINYLHLNADKYGLTAQELDDARLKHIRGSSMLEAIERCLDYLDESSMPELQRGLENAIKTVVGLPSKVGCSRVLVSLSTRQNFIFKPYADHFLPLARKQVFDRNDTISSSYAAALGYLARLASDEALLELVESCRKLYFDSDDDRHRVISGDITFAISKYATDRFNSLASEILPFVFIAKHDTYERAKTLFEETWGENVGGSRAVLLYLKEIVGLASQYLDSPRWSVKHTSAFAVADVVTSSGSNIDDANAKILWPALEKALSGKTWDGKEEILKALIKFTKNSTFWSDDPKVAEQVEKIILRESKRNNTAFRKHSLECLGDFAELRETVDMYPEVYDITKPVIEEGLDESEEMDIDSKNGGPSSKTTTEAIVTNAITALLKSINPRKRAGEDLIASLSHTLQLMDRVKAQASRNTMNAIYDAQKTLFERLSKADLKSISGPLEDVLIEYVHRAFGFTEQVEQTRLKATEAAIALAPIASRGARIKADFGKELAAAKVQERSISVQQGLDRAKKIIDA
ncbi:proteasome component ECM29, partial [Lecanoromycetidae sp. Uapishka_2]